MCLVARHRLQLPANSQHPPHLWLDRCNMAKCVERSVCVDVGSILALWWWWWLWLCLHGVTRVLPVVLFSPHSLLLIARSSTHPPSSLLSTPPSSAPSRAGQNDITTGRRRWSRQVRDWVSVDDTMHHSFPDSSVCFPALSLLSSLPLLSLSLFYTRMVNFDQTCATARP